MAQNELFDPSMDNPLAKYVIAFFGTLFGFLLLPRTIKYVIRRFLFGTIGEIIAVVITALLTEKAVDAISHDD